MVKNTLSPTTKLKPGSYTISSWPSGPAHPLNPITREEQEVLGFYDQTRIISIDRDSGLFVYNPKIPKACQTPPGIVLGSHRPTFSIDATVDSPLFWRPKLLVARMRYLRKTVKYNPYLRYGARRRPGREREATEELETYLSLKAYEDNRKNRTVENKELMEYVSVLECRERARQAEEQVDAARMKRLCEKSRLNMEKAVDRDSTQIKEASRLSTSQGKKARVRTSPPKASKTPKTPKTRKVSKVSEVQKAQKAPKVRNPARSKTGSSTKLDAVGTRSDTKNIFFFQGGLKSFFSSRVD